MSSLNVSFVFTENSLQYSSRVLIVHFNIFLFSFLCRFCSNVKVYGGGLTCGDRQNSHCASLPLWWYWLSPWSRHSGLLSQVLLALWPIWVRRQNCLPSWEQKSSSGEVGLWGSILTRVTYLPVVIQWVGFSLLSPQRWWWCGLLSYRYQSLVLSDPSPYQHGPRFGISL